MTGKAIAGVAAVLIASVVVGSQVSSGQASVMPAVRVVPAGDAPAGQNSSDLALRVAVLESRLAAVEARAAALEARLIELLRQPALPGATLAPAATDPVASAVTPPTPADAYGAQPNLSGVPAAVTQALQQLHPGGQVIDRGRDAGDGYWWFEVRVGNRLFDVEITDTGTVRKNRRTLG
jgi:hypothetical protein